jgi:hypothetical protein
VLTTAALAEEAGPVRILVDTPSAVESLRRVLRSTGRKVETTETMGTTVFMIGPR